MKTEKQMRLRAAPSPTGRMHIGNLRTFLNNFLCAKSLGAKFILRIEDTDRNRYKPGGTEALIETLALFGITFDEGPHIGGDYGPYIQSERKHLYKKYAEQLIDNGNAYYCFCTKERLAELKEHQIANKLRPGYDRHCRDIPLEEARKRVANGELHVIRMKFPLEGYTEFECAIHGKIKSKNSGFTDEIILKTDEYPTYHFGVVVDDHLMGITHIFRGREYLSQTPKNIFLYKAFGWDIPIFVHPPVVLNPDGKGKLSKRKGALPATLYLRKGYLPEAIVNYLALAGWAPPEDKKNNDDIYTMDELVKLFSLDRMQKSNARFDQNKFDYINSKHIRRLSIDQLVKAVSYWAKNYVLGEFIADKFDDHFDWEKYLQAKVEKYLPLWEADDEKFKKALALEHDRIKYFAEIPDALAFFYEDKLVLTDESWNTKNHGIAELKEGLKKVLPKLDEMFVSGEYDHEKWESIVRSTADELGWKAGDLFMAIRTAVTGRLQSPPLLESIEVLGWEKAKRFIENAMGN